MKPILNPDKDAVMRFVNAAIKSQPYDAEDARHAAFALLWSLRKDGKPIRRVLGAKPRSRGPKHDMEQVYIDSPVFAIAMSFYAGDCTKVEAINGICQHYQDIDIDINERTAGAYLDQLEDRARKMNSEIDSLLTLAERTREK